MVVLHAFSYLANNIYVYTLVWYIVKCFKLMGFLSCISIRSHTLKLHVIFYEILFICYDLIMYT